MENRTALARIVFVMLLGIFVWKCSDAVSKYLDPGKGQKISVVDYEKVDFPTFAICPVFRDARDKSLSVDGLADAYYKVPPVHEVFPFVHYFLKETDVFEVNQSIHYRKIGPDSVV